MADNKSLKALEADLNKSADLRGAFLKDPVKTLKDGGVELSADQAAQVRAQFAEMGLKKMPELAKISIKIRIKIGIGIAK